MEEVLHVLAEGMRLTIPEPERKMLDNDLCVLYDAMVLDDEERAQFILRKWGAPPQCYSMLQMALMANKMRDGIHD
jgi:hypothetical protein